MELVTRSLTTCEEFESKAGLAWAREIIVDYYTRTEEGWLLGCMVKVLSVSARHNPCQGGLSLSFLLEVEYKIGAKLSREAWFVKVPKSLQTVAMDQRELVMYNKIFPRLQVFLSEELYEDQEVDLPIPIIFASSFKGDGVHDFLVTENLRASNYFQVDKHTTKIAYMTAAMDSLANTHGITLSFMKSLGGREALLQEFPTITEQTLPESEEMRKTFNKTIEAYLTYLGTVLPDIAQQTRVLAKFSKFLFRVFLDLENSESLKNLRTLVHGDAKLDNFLFKKVKEKLEETYTAMLIDWQGCGFDLVSNDLMWCLHGFVKNLPETGDMIHGFVEYTCGVYWGKLSDVLKAFGDSFSDFNLPESPEQGADLIKEGFTLEFMKNALIRPVLSLKSRRKLMKWWSKVKRGEEVSPPAQTEIFKTESYSSFIFLFFKIATEINVFSHLGKMLLIYMKESLLGDKRDMEEENDEDEEDFDTDDDEDKEELVTEENDPNPGTEEEPDSKSKEEFCISILEHILDKTFSCIKEKEPKTVTSLYGKVYALKPSIKSL